MKMCTVYEIPDCQLMRIMRRSSIPNNDDFVPIQLQQQRQQLRRSPSSPFQSGAVGVRRALFRERIDHEETDRYLRLQMSEIHAEARSRWNFDFGDDVPLRGRYEWTPVTSDCKVREEEEKEEDDDETDLESGNRSDRGVESRAAASVDPTGGRDGGDRTETDLPRKNSVQTKMTDFAKQRKRPSSLSLKSTASSSPSSKSIIDTTTSMISHKLRRLASSCADDGDDAPSSSWVAAADSRSDGGKSPSLTT